MWWGHLPLRDAESPTITIYHPHFQRGTEDKYPAQGHSLNLNPGLYVKCMALSDAK